MLSTLANFTGAAIIGAGPYGLSIAAHLRATDVPFRIFGRPMQFWATQMPEGMHLKSPGAALNLWGGSETFMLDQFCASTARLNAGAAAPISLEHFVAYGEEFARRFVPSLEDEHIRSINRTDGGFRISTASGERFLTRRVVMAIGLTAQQHMPAELRHLPSSRVTHPSQHRSYGEFAGRDVTVLGSGASSLNTAVLLHEAGARVTLVARARKLRIDPLRDSESHSQLHRLLHPATPLGRGLRNRLAGAAPDLYRSLPWPLQQVLSGKQLQRSGDSALQGRVQGFPTLLGCRVHAVEPADGRCDRLRLTLTDRHGQASQHLTSHLLAGTGYRFDKDRLGILSQSLREQIRVGGSGAPRLNRRFESSVPGLHFVGPLAAPSFGPLLRTIAGTQFAAERVVRALQRSLAREQRRNTQALVLSVAAQRERTL